MPEKYRIAGYQGKDFAQAVKDNYQSDWQGVKGQAFQIMPWHWIVETTLTWLVRYRRLVIG